MRILIILENYYPRIGGVETFFKSLVDTLDAEGHIVTVLTNRYDHSLKSEEKYGQHITVIRKSFYNRYLFTFFAWWAALKIARQADLIHTTSYNAAVPAWIASKITGTKAIITFHERYGDLWNRLPWMSSISKFLHRNFEKFITKLNFNKFVAVSDFTKESLIRGGVDSNKVLRIYNGIKYEGFPKHVSPTSGAPFSFMFYGRVGYAKGLDILLEGYHALIEEGHTNHQLILVLPSEKTSLFLKIQELISQLGVKEFISIYHDLKYSDLLAKISNVDCVIIPSYSEGFCYVAAETMAVGTPIISSGQGALKEVVNGKHITLENHTSSDMNKAMQKALLGDWVISASKKFILKDTIQAYLKLYKETVS